MTTLLNLLIELERNRVYLELLKDECEMQFLNNQEFEIARGELYMKEEEVKKNLAGIEASLTSEVFLN